MAEKRPTNSELAFARLAEEESQGDEPKGIFELFDRDEDAPLARDADEE
jgi:hypothetical protein